MTAGNGAAAFAADSETEPVSEPAEPETDHAEGWRVDKKGRQFVPARGRSGTVYRQGNETVEEAWARDANGPTQRGPKRKTAPRVPKAPPPRQVSLQEIERALVGVLTAPSGIAAMQGDTWAAEHIDRVGPVLARNLCKAAETNPWLRAKLEAAMTGSDLLLFKILGLYPVFMAGVAYIVPLIVYYADPGFLPAGTRAAFEVPIRPSAKDRRTRAEITRREFEQRLAAEQADLDAFYREMSDAADSEAAAATAEPETAQAAA